MKKNVFKNLKSVLKSHQEIILICIGILMIGVGLLFHSSKADPSSTLALGNIKETLELDEAYIEQASMVDDSTTESKKKIVTGSVPFDTEYGEEIEVELKSGDDNTPNNNIVRTFDIVDYTVNFTTKIQSDSEAVAFQNGKIYFEFVLPYSSEEVIFSTDQMGWLESKQDIIYKISEFDHENSDGTTSKWQVLKGSFRIVPTVGEETSIGNHYRELNICIRVLSMKNKAEVQPYFTFWLQGNDVFNGQDFSSSIETWYNDTSLITFSENRCQTHKDENGEGVIEYKTITPPKIIVTGTPRYNVAVVNGDEIGRNQQLGTFDFSTGNENAGNKDKGLVTGRMIGIGIRIELLGKTKEHGLKGVELPSGEITFDLELSTTYDGKDVSNEYQTLLYSLDNNNDNVQKQDDRIVNVQNKNITYLPYSQFSQSKYYYKNCYDSGSWNYSIEDNKIRVNVNDYQINLAQIPYTNAASSEMNYTYYNPNEITGYWDIQQAIFSVGQVWIVQDFYNSNAGSEYYNKKVDGQYGESNFKVTLKESNLKMHSISESPLYTQMTINDEQTTWSFSMENKGKFNGSLAYIKYNCSDYNDALTEGAWDNGKDIQIKGGKLKIESWMVHDGAEELNIGVAYDHLIKWDDMFFEPDGNVDHPYETKKKLWAAKKDKTGWNHYGLKPDEDGYDQEMRNATVDDLIYFESLDELRKQGYVPVGFLIEYRRLRSSGMNHLHVYVGGTVKENCPAGYTYMATYTLRGWNKDNIKDLVAEANSVEINSPGDYGKITDEMYDNYAKNNMPSRSDSSITNYDTYPESFEIFDSTTYDNLKNYQKAKYDENGYVSGSIGKNGGDSCYVADHFMNVTMMTGQLGTNQDGSKRVYDMDESQRIVDYVIKPSIITGYDKDQNKTGTTTVTVESTLGKGLTYIEGSSYLGGTYQESSRGQGVITGGKSIQPILISNSDGTRTLRWILENIEYVMDKEVLLDSIYYSCQIGNLSSEELDVKNGQLIDTTVKIKSSTDYVREYISSNKNISTTTIQIQKSNSLSLFNSADKVSNEVEDGIGFLTSYKNNSNSPTYAILVNGLPYHGDGVSSFSGELYVTELSVGSPKEEEHSTVVNNFNFYYTTNISYRGKTSSELESENFLDTSVWQKLEIEDMNGNSSNPKLPNAKVKIPDNFSPVLIVAVGNLPGQGTIDMHVTLSLSETNPGDYLANFSSQGKLSSYSYAYFISRMLEGKVWIDTNRNGLQGSSEKELPKVKVTLMKLKDSGDKNNESDYEPYLFDSKEVVVETGNQIDVTSGSISKYQRTFPSTGEETSLDSGAYRFYNLPAGTFGVRIESSEDVSLLDYELSPKNQGSNDEIDSDGSGTYDINQELEKVFIEGIVIESLENSSVRYYESRYHDVGIYPVYRLDYKLVKTENLKRSVSGAEFSLYQLNCTDPSHHHDEMMISTTEDQECFKYIGSTTSNKDGEVIFRKLLDDREYRLVETKVPFDRKKPEGQWKIVITNGEYQMTTLGGDVPDFINEEGKWLLPNQPITLPFTGGIGVYIFYTIGIILIIISTLSIGYFLYRKRKR